MKPVIIISIAVVCSVVAVTLDYALYPFVISSESEEESLVYAKAQQVHSMVLYLTTSFLAEKNTPLVHVENSCIQDYIDKMEIKQCSQDEYVEGGFDSPEQCILHYMNRLPDC